MCMRSDKKEKKHENQICMDMPYKRVKYVVDRNKSNSVVSVIVYIPFSVKAYTLHFMLM